MNTTFTFANVRIYNDPAHQWTVDFDLTLDGDTYQVSYEWNEDPDYGNSLSVTLDGHDQYWDGEDGPFDAGSEKSTHFSRTIAADELTDWIVTTFIDPIWAAQRAVIAAAQGASGAVTWEREEVQP